MIHLLNTGNTLLSFSYLYVHCKNFRSFENSFYFVHYEPWGFFCTELKVIYFGRSIFQSSLIVLNKYIDVFCITPAPKKTLLIQTQLSTRLQSNSSCFLTEVGLLC